MKTVIIFLLIVFTFSFTDIFSQSDSSKKFMWSVSANVNYRYNYEINYNFINYKPFMYNEGYFFPDLKEYPTISTNENIYLYFKLSKRLKFKTGLTYFNRRYIYSGTSSYRTGINGYVFPAYDDIKEKVNTNSFDIPVSLSLNYNKFYADLGLVTNIINFVYKTDIIGGNDKYHKTEITSSLKTNQYLESSIVYINCNIGYLIYNKPFPIYINAGISTYYDYGATINSLFFSLGINAFIGKR